MEQQMAKKGKMWLIWAGMIILFLLSPVLYFVHMEIGLGSLIRTLPSDEKMIVNFREHREDFNKLVRIVQYDSSAKFEAFSLVPTPQIEMVMNRANVAQITSDLEIGYCPIHTLTRRG